jgi:hypothetical protein
LLPQAHHLESSDALASIWLNNVCPPDEEASWVGLRAVTDTQVRNITAHIGNGTVSVTTPGLAAV